jgi:hypothetical protein
MDREKLELIQELMEEVIGQMDESPAEMEARIPGRKKPDAGITVMSVEGKGMPGLEKAEEKMLGDCEDDMEEEYESEDPMMKRLAKIRG